jgi:putative addiction module component (TIGR02574 family)
MSSDPQAILAAALALPESDRAMIAERLLDSLPDDDKDLNDVDLMSDEELEAELERRAAEYAKDPSVAIPWSEFRWDDPS